MYFYLKTWDAKTAEAAARRIEIRDRHLRTARGTLGSGRMLLGGAVLSQDASDMIGSLAVLEFKDRDAFDGWLTGLPFFKEGIWERIETGPYRLAVETGHPVERQAEALGMALTALSAALTADSHDQLRDLFVDLPEATLLLPDRGYTGHSIAEGIKDRPAAQEVRSQEILHQSSGLAIVRFQTEASDGERRDVWLATLTFKTGEWLLMTLAVTCHSIDPLEI